MMCKKRRENVWIFMILNKSYSLHFFDSGCVTERRRCGVSDWGDRVHPKHSGVTPTWSNDFIRATWMKKMTDSHFHCCNASMSRCFWNPNLRHVHEKWFVHRAGTVMFQEMGPCWLCLGRNNTILLFLIDLKKIKNHSTQVVFFVWLLWNNTPHNFLCPGLVLILNIFKN